MCKAYEATKRVVRGFSQKDSFTREELYRAIRRSGGVLRIRPGYSVRKYLDDLEYRGLYQYNPKEQKYIRIQQQNRG